MQNNAHPKPLINRHRQPATGNRQRLFLAVVILTLAIFPSSPLMAQASLPFPCATEDDPLVVRLYYQTRDNLKALAARFDIWEAHHDRSYVVIGTRCGDLEKLRSLGLPLEVETAKTLAARPLLLTLPLYPCYRTVEETVAGLQALAANYPSLTELIDIGDSWDKATGEGPAGYDLWVLKITNKHTKAPKPAFFLMAETHAREMATAETAIRFAEHLLQRYGLDADITFLLDYYELHLMPLANPDGRKKAEQGSWWRKNTDSDDGCAGLYYGVDLNRNYAFYWGGASANPCDELYQGPTPASEPETRAVQDYLRGLYQDLRGSGDVEAAPDHTPGISVTLHAYGKLVLWPWGFTHTPAPNAAQLEAIGRRLAAINGYTAQQSVDLYPATGTSDDWVYGELGLASFNFELGTTFFQDCNAFESTVWPDNREALLYAFKLAAAPYKSAFGPEALLPGLSPSRVKAGFPVRLSVVISDELSGGQPIGGGEFFVLPRHVPLPPGPPGTGLALAAASDRLTCSRETMEATLDTALLPPGRYLVVLRGKDLNENWGPFSSVWLTVEGEYQIYLPLLKEGE